MKILVTGGSGFLGLNLIKKLVSLNYQVTGLSRSIPNNAPCPWMACDLVTQENLDALLRGFDVIFHTASKVGMWGNEEDFIATNITATEKLIKAAINVKVKKLVYTSTPSVVFGREDLLGVDESTPYPKHFLTHYARTKAQAEKLVLGSNGQGELNTTALRPHLIYGEGDPHLLPRLKEAALKKRIKIIGRGQNLVDVIYVHNAVDAHILAMHQLGPGSKNAGKAYFISQERPVNCWEFINTLLVQQGVPPLKKSVPLWLAYGVGAMIEFIFTLLKITKKDPPMTRFIALQLGKSHFFNLKNAREDFHYSPKISIEESLERMKKDLIANN